MAFGKTSGFKKGLDTSSQFGSSRNSNALSDRTPCPRAAAINTPESINVLITHRLPEIHLVFQLFLAQYPPNPEVFPLMRQFLREFLSTVFPKAF
jgi:hypothetical protein